MSQPSAPALDPDAAGTASLRRSEGQARTDFRVVVVAGGLDFERDVSMRSGRRVSAALRHAGLDVEVLDADARLLPALAEHPCDAVFIALHGASGEDGSLRSVLELAGVPYAGSGSTASRLAWDKPGAKVRVRDAGIATPDWVALPHSTYRELGAGAVLDLILSRLGLPLMLKPAQGGSALGTVKVSTVQELPEAMIGSFAYADSVLIERFISGTEIAVSVIDRPGGPAALPAVEIVPRSGVFDYAARYTPGMTEYFTPARLDDTTAARAAEVALSVHRTLGLSGLSRTDAIVTPDGEVHFLEVNVSPGMTDTSMLPMSVVAAGLDFGTVLADLLRAAARPTGSRLPAHDTGNVTAG
ncbi:MAG: D-alanine--D-alanine ligase [Geodermatophilaceae bacterium]|nr:D-alanine--D-alanine ligase [Geodermatophilaceae bacterium]